MYGRWQSNSPDETLSLAQALGRTLRGGLTIALVGPLGAGKTHFAKGVALGNGATDTRQVTSPTFVLLNEYAGRFCLYHLDAYRLPSAASMAALGFDELLTPQSAAIVEWADRVRTILPEDVVWIEILPTGETEREISARADGPNAEACLEAWVAQACEEGAAGLPSNPASPRRQ